LTTATPIRTAKKKDKRRLPRTEEKPIPSIMERRRSSITVSRWLLLFSALLLASCLVVAVVVPVVLRHFHHPRLPRDRPSSGNDDGNGEARFDDDDRKKKRDRYGATQFISFTINTLGGSASDGECDVTSGIGRGGADPAAVDPDGDAGRTCYLGSPNATEDVRRRLAILERALARLKENAFDEDNAVDRSPRVLKIFMVPEFYLRGPYGAYTPKDAYDDPDDDEDDGVLIRYSDRLREIVSDGVFEDYLFVFGTVIVAQALDGGDDVDDDRHRKNQTLSASRFLYFNLAPVLKGGSGGREHRYLFQKRYISGADFLSGQASLPDPSDEDLHLYSDEPWEGMVETAAARGTRLVRDGNLIVVDGIRIGIEICLDHRMGVLWNNLQTAGGNGGDLVDVQLIVSAGMAIERGPNPIVAGGVVYLADGGASSAACLRTDDGRYDPGKVCRGRPDGLKHVGNDPGWGGPGYSNFFPPAACLDMEGKAERDLLWGYYSLYQPQGCAYTLKLYGIDVMDEFKYYPPSLEIYPTVDLPPPSS